MFEQSTLWLVSAFLLGVIVGVLVMLLINRFRGGVASPAKLKQEMQDYQDAVEKHFDETSRKFKDMTAHYQDLYQHLATGATNLCRTENMAPALSKLSDSESLLVDESSKSDKEITTETAKEAPAEDVVSETEGQQDEAATTDDGAKLKEADEKVDQPVSKG